MGDLGFDLKDCVLWRQSSSSQGPPPVNMPMHTDDRDIWNSFGSGFHSREVGESSQAAGIQTVQRVKRQNCGNTVQRQHNVLLGSRNQVGYWYNAEVEEKSNYGSRIMSTGQYSMTDQGSRNFRGPPEVGSSSSPFDGRVSAEGYCGSAAFLNSERQTLWHNGYVDDSHVSNSYSQSCIGIRSSCKRKSSMDNVIGSLSFGPLSEQGEINYSRLNEDAGPSRANTTLRIVSDFVPTSRNLISDDLHYPRGNSVVCPSITPTSFHDTQSGSSNRHQGGSINRSQEGPFSVQRVSWDSLPSQPWVSRMAANGHAAQSASTLDIPSFSQRSAASAVIPWGGNGTSFIGLSRDLNAANHSRHLLNGGSLWRCVPPRTSITFETSTSRGLLGLRYQEPVLQASPVGPVRPLHLGSFASSRLPVVPLPRHDGYCPQGRLHSHPLSARPHTSSVYHGSQAVLGTGYSSYGLFNRSASATDVGMSPRHNAYGMTFRGVEALPSQRGNGQRFSSHDILDYAVMYTGFNMHDQLIAMQPDVDNMSYEELLALEERIGNVNTGISEENIYKCLKRSKYPSYDSNVGVMAEESEIKCSICQEEYMPDEEVGQLECTHSYHTACIKQWLVLKNQCPICKAAAYVAT